MTFVICCDQSLGSNVIPKNLSGSTVYEVTVQRAGSYGAMKEVGLTSETSCMEKSAAAINKGIKSCAFPFLGFCFAFTCIFLEDRRYRRAQPRVTHGQEFGRSFSIIKLVARFDFALLQLC